MGDPIRILVVDNRALFWEGLIRLLQSEPDFQLVANCDSVARARDILRRTPVDLVLLDYDLGEESAAELLRELQGSPERTKVIVITAGASGAITSEVFNAGVVGVLYKHRRPAELVKAIRKILTGELWLYGGALRSLIAASKERGGEGLGRTPLSLRQQEVLSGILEGLSNKEMARKFQVSITTIKDVVQQLLEMAGVRTRSQLIRIALRNQTADWLKWLRFGLGGRSSD
jgi:two-component system, NarL family, nitrate/nitrite response regulator NarL